MSKGGRPRVELSDEHVALIERLASYGLTQAQIADCLPIAERTLRDRISDTEDEAVSAAYARGRARDAEVLSSRHRDIAMGRLKKTPVSEQRKALEWRLERQHKWSQRLEHTGRDGRDLSPTIVILPAKGDGDE